MDQLSNIDEDFSSGSIESISLSNTSQAKDILYMKHEKDQTKNI